MRQQPHSQRVSIVVPTYNQVDYLAPCLDSILFQDHPNIEIVVVDDCSTDGTNEMLTEYVAEVREASTSFAARYDDYTDEIKRIHHPRFPQTGRDIVVLRNKINQGSTRTYNRGFRACTGQLCTYVASDDLCHPSMISTLVSALESTGSQFAYSDTYIIDDAGRILRQFQLPDYSFERSFCDWYLCGVSKLYERSLHERIGYYDERFLANDHELYLRFAIAGVRFHHVPKTLYSIRSHRDREVDVHSRDNWKRLLEESKSLVQRARRHRLQASGPLHSWRAVL